MPKVEREPSDPHTTTALRDARRRGPERPAGQRERISPSAPHVRQASRGVQILFALSGVVLGLLLIHMLREVLGAFVLGALLAFVIAPWVDWMAARGVPRTLAIMLIFLGLAALVAGLVGMFIPLVTGEISRLQDQVPAIATTAQNQLIQLRGTPIQIYGIKLELASMAEQASARSREFVLSQFGNALSLGLVALTTLLQVLLMLVAAFLIAHDSRSITRVIRSFVPADYRTDFDVIWLSIKSMLRNYLRGQLIIAAIIGIASGLAVWILGLPFPLALGVLAGLTAMIPYLGPFLGAAPAILVALSFSPFKALLLGIAYLVISNLVLNIVYPKVVGTAVNLSALVVIVALIAGFTVSGVLGMFVAVPLAATLRILFDYLQPRLFGSHA